MSQFLKIFLHKNVRYKENYFFRNILFDASEYLFNFDLNYGFGTNKCLCLFDVLQKNSWEFLKMAQTEAERRRNKRWLVQKKGALIVD